MDDPSDEPDIHQPSGRWRLGLTLALATALLWSTVPVALRLLLDRMDPVTITWYGVTLSVKPARSRKPGRAKAHPGHPA